MKNLLYSIAIIAASLFTSCSGNEMIMDDDYVAAPTSGQYNSLAEFHKKYESKPITISFDESVGATYTTAQGTIISIPPNAFDHQDGSSVSGTVQIEFKDIYTKSEMVLSDKSTMLAGGQPLNSAGEFFIRPTQNNVALKINDSASISITLPAPNGVDTAMTTFTGTDSSGIFGFNYDASAYQLFYTASSYIFTIFDLSVPYDSGTWSNCDNPNPFGIDPQTNLTLHCNTDNIEQAEMYLVFTNQTTGIHVYGLTDFQYPFAPLGYDCTIVVLALKDGDIYSAFIPITITTNLSMNFEVAKTTDQQFKDALDALN